MTLTAHPLDPQTIDLEWWRPRTESTEAPLRNYCIVCLKLFRDVPRSEFDFVNCKECRKVFETRSIDANCH